MAGKSVTWSARRLTVQASSALPSGMDECFQNGTKLTWCLHCSLTSSCDVMQDGCIASWPFRMWTGELLLGRNWGVVVLQQDNDYLTSTLFRIHISEEGAVRSGFSESVSKWDCTEGLASITQNLLPKFQKKSSGWKPQAGAWVYVSIAVFTLDDRQDSSVHQFRDFREVCMHGLTYEHTK